ncbi:MAG TPA: hypothetical protein VNM14_05895 [Planctomycetota bacterium]|jgi:hypothetical protein|nr:hypothetical protein [Planctomycetota bacterium]
MVRCLAALSLLISIPAFADEPDTVRLKCGRILAGKVHIDDADPEGFSVQRWDTGGTVFVRWAQISRAERDRLVNRVVEVKSVETMIDGVRALTPGRDVVGVLVKEDATLIHIKTKDSKAALVVPKSALFRPYERVRIPESEAYNPDERVDLRAAKANLKDFGALMELGKFATSVRLFERAKEYLVKAAATDPSKKQEAEEALARNESLMKEAKAGALVARARELADSIEFLKALDLLRQLQGDLAETDTAKQNRELTAQIEKRAKEYESKRGEFLAHNVPQAYKDRRGALFIQYGSPKFKIAEALAKAQKIDDELVAELAKRFKATPDEIQVAWGKRELEPRTVMLGEGTWIVKGGQDGGLDTPLKTPANVMNIPQGIQLGKPLQKRQEWWLMASQWDRRTLIEAEYAKNSSVVKKEIKLRKCVTCKGEGVFQETRMGVDCECKCLRCHGVKDDETIVYQ